MSSNSSVPPIIQAAEQGDVATLTRLLDGDPDLILARSRLGTTPLHAAARQGGLAACELLVRRGADVNAIGNQGRTPLHEGALAGSPGVVRLLLDHEADPARVDNRSLTPLAAAVENVEVGRPETEAVVRLLKAVAGPSDLRSAVVEGDAVRVHEILAADPKAVTAHPDPGELLFTAVVRQEEAGSAAIIELLLAHGADPNARSRQWPELPIARATDPATIELLVRHGAKRPQRHGR